MNYILVNKTSFGGLADNVSQALINLDHVKSVEPARRGIKAHPASPRAIINFAVGLENPSEESPADFIAVTDSLDDIIIKINQAKS